MGLEEIRGMFEDWEEVGEIVIRAWVIIKNYVTPANLNSSKEI